MNSFDEFWAIYPARNGKRLGKIPSQRRFDKLSEADQALCLTATRNYANCKMIKSGYGIKDPERFLWDGRNHYEYWREWIEPEVVVSMEEIRMKEEAIERAKEKIKQMYITLRRKKGDLDAMDCLHPEFASRERDVEMLEAKIKQFETKLRG